MAWEVANSLGGSLESKTLYIYIYISRRGETPIHMNERDLSASVMAVGCGLGVAFISHRRVFLPLCLTDRRAKPV